MDKSTTYVVGAKHASRLNYSSLVGAKVKIVKPYHSSRCIVYETEEPYRGLGGGKTKGPHWSVHKEDLLSLEMDNQSALVFLKQI